jgi:hypothetical protein
MSFSGRPRCESAAVLMSKRPYFELCGNDVILNQIFSEDKNT